MYEYFLYEYFLYKKTFSRRINVIRHAFQYDRRRDEGLRKNIPLPEMLEKEYPRHFDHIFLLCPTYWWNKTYQKWTHKDDKKFHPVPCDHEAIENFVKYISEAYAGTNSLIILDDCANSQMIKNRTSEIVRLGFSAKHLGLSTIIITQQLTSEAKPYRENISKLVTFYNPNKKDMQTILDENLFVDIEGTQRR